MLYRTAPAAIDQLGEREVRLRIMTGGVKRDGLDLDPQGVRLANYRQNPVQLFQHDTSCPVASNDQIVVDAGGISARCVFAPAGISAKADEVCGLVKAGIVRSVSIGFEIIEPKRPRAGEKITAWELLECSFVSVPADPSALVTARAHAAGAAAEFAPEPAWHRGPMFCRNLQEYAAWCAWHFNQVGAAAVRVGLAEAERKADFERRRHAAERLRPR